MTISNKICKTCGTQFKTKRSHTWFCSRLCYRRNPEVAARYRQRTKDFQRRHARVPKRKLDKVKAAANKKKMDFNISLSKYVELLDRGCFYCGGDLHVETGVCLDRIDNHVGYIESNVLPCCGKCNQIRNQHLTVEEMKIAMEAIIKHRRSLGKA